MLTEERHQKLLNLVNTNQTVSTQELVDHLDTSESTLRRDLLELESKGLLWRIRGGAKARNIAGMNDNDSRVSARRTHNAPEKKKMAEFASQLIEPGDTVYIDGGTSTEFLIEQIQQKDAFYITNAIFHANKLAAKGFSVSLVGGQYKGNNHRGGSLRVFRQVQFLNRIFRNQRRQPVRFYHSGYFRRHAQAKGDFQMPEKLCPG